MNKYQNLSGTELNRRLDANLNVAYNSTEVNAILNELAFRQTTFDQLAEIDDLAVEGSAGYDI